MRVTGRTNKRSGASAATGHQMLFLTPLAVAAIFGRSCSSWPIPPNRYFKGSSNQQPSHVVSSSFAFPGLKKSCLHRAAAVAAAASSMEAAAAAVPRHDVRAFNQQM